MNIPKLPDIPDNIKNAAIQGKLIIFVGAGVSRLLGCPSWTEFAEKHLEAIKNAGIINHFVYDRLKEMGQRDPRKLLTICKVLIKEAGLKKINIGEMLKPDPVKLKKHKIYQYLYSFNAVYVTTNFDDLLDRELKKRRLVISPRPSTPNATTTPLIKPEDCKVFYKENDLHVSTLINNGNIIHLHGCLNDPDNLIITFPEYAKHYEAGSRASFLLQGVFKKTVLFVGYGLEEYEILEYILQKAGTTKNEIKHTMLLAAFKEESELMDQMKKYYQGMGIQLIPFSKTENGHEQLEEVIKKWSQEIGSIAEPPGFLENKKIIDEVI